MHHWRPRVTICVHIAHVRRYIVLYLSESLCVLPGDNGSRARIVRSFFSGVAATDRRARAAAAIAQRGVEAEPHVYDGRVAFRVAVVTAATRNRSRKNGPSSITRRSIIAAAAVRHRRRRLAATAAVLMGDNNIVYGTDSAAVTTFGSASGNTIRAAAVGFGISSRVVAFSAQRPAVTCDRCAPQTLTR